MKSQGRAQTISVSANVAHDTERIHSCVIIEWCCAADYVPRVANCITLRRFGVLQNCKLITFFRVASENSQFLIIMIKFLFGITQCVTMVNNKQMDFSCWLHKRLFILDFLNAQEVFEFGYPTLILHWTHSHKIQWAIKRLYNRSV